LIRPKLTFKQVLDQKGYPIISKSTARTISRYRGTKFLEMKEYYKHGTKNGAFVGKLSVIAKKHHYLIDAPFKISDECCESMKKKPFKIYEKETGLKPYIGIMASDSNSRKMGYLKTGCNAFDIKHPHSTPLGFWLEKDIWEYIKQYNVPYCKIYDTGVKRTGCIFCMFGVNREKSPNRFELLKKTHPELWSYCINKLDLGTVLDYMKVPYGKEKIEVTK
jgi:3'-phosphoadenosine 5'-phosphosulfate sulfotransferase (PAPS reductase)/FAD synthetase